MTRYSNGSTTARLAIGLFWQGSLPHFLESTQALLVWPRTTVRQLLEGISQLVNVLLVLRQPGQARVWEARWQVRCSRKGQAARGRCAAFPLRATTLHIRRWCSLPLPAALACCRQEGALCRLPWVCVGDARPQRRRWQAEEWEDRLMVTDTCFACEAGHYCTGSWLSGLVDHGDHNVHGTEAHGNQ